MKNKRRAAMVGAILVGSGILGVRVADNGQEEPQPEPVMASCAGTLVDGRVYAPAEPCQEGGFDFVVVDGLPSAPPGR